ncbi:MAG: phosphatase PAP2 family protein, partial [Acetatifactor sp.]
MNLDLGILNLMQVNCRGPILDSVIPFITKLGDGGIIWLLGSLVLLVIPQMRKTGIAMLLSLALEVLCCNVILKPLVGRVRPCDVNSAVQLLIERPTDFSFPSGHTGASFAAVSALFFSKNRLWVPSLVLAILIAFSRLYLYVHYPS